MLHTLCADTAQCRQFLQPVDHKCSNLVSVIASQRNNQLNACGRRTAISSSSWAIGRTRKSRLL